MRRLILPVLFLGFVSALRAFAGESQTLVVGEQASLPVEPGTRFSVGNGEVIQVRSTQVPGGHSLLLVKGKNQGYSDLILLGPQGGRSHLGFRVVSKRGAPAPGAREAPFSPGSGLSLSPTGAGWVTRGTSRSLEDWNTERAVEASARGRVQSVARLHPLARVKAETQIRRRLRDAGLAQVSVKSAGSTVLLYGDVDSSGDKELAESLAREVLLDVRSQIRVPFERGGRLRFHARILEILRESARSLGLEWADGVPSAVQVSPSSAHVSLALDAALHLLEKKGQARLLAQPQLLLNEKGSAELQVGGEIPISMKGHFFSAVQWKQYGLTLHLDLPGVSRDLARTHIVVEISTLDPVNGAEGVPALRLSKMDTLVDLNVGKAVLLSGLLESRQSRNASGLPFLSDIPVLGELFRSHDFQENRSELVIVLEADT